MNDSATGPVFCAKFVETEHLESIMVSGRVLYVSLKNFSRTLSKIKIRFESIKVNLKIFPKEFQAATDVEDFSNEA